jgi:hypothetical protein
VNVGSRVRVGLVVNVSVGSIEVTLCGLAFTPKARAERTRAERSCMAYTCEYEVSEFVVKTSDEVSFFIATVLVDAQGQ